MGQPEMTDQRYGADPVRIVLTVEQAASTLGIGRTSMFALVRTGDVESVTIGRLRRIPIEALNDFVDKLRRGQVDSQGGPDK
jgi:excisionase family DNA binding protein